MDSSISSAKPFDFSGSIPEHYDQYLGPLFFEPYAIEVASRINPSSVSIALELACGTGRVTRQLRKVLSPGSRLIASDVSADMMNVAREKLKEEAIEWQVIDAQQLPFEDNSLDLVVCCFGYMFVPDKAKAFSEAHRVLKQGGMFLFTTWDKLENNAASCVYRTIAKKYLQDALPEVYNLPFSMSDETIIKEILQQAGFFNFNLEKLIKPAVSSSARAAAEGLTKGGLMHNEIMSRNPAWMDEIRASVEKELSEKFGEAPMSAPMQAIIAQAWK